MPHPPNIFLAVAILVTVCLCSCSKLDGEQRKCQEFFLDLYDMEAYADEEIRCQFFITLHSEDGRYIAIPGSHCADLLPLSIFDCDGEEWCFSSDTTSRYEDLEDLGVIGISR